MDQSQELLGLVGDAVCRPSFPFLAAILTGGGRRWEVKS